MNEAITALRGRALERRFQLLDSLLAASAHWWRARPFHQRGYCWQDSHPDLCAALDRLADSELEHLQQNPIDAIRWLSPWVADGRRLHELSRLPRLSQRVISPPERLDHGIPGRKWQQLLAFASSVAPVAEPVLEWCAGKGHLGRLLAVVDRRAVTSLEWQAQLCAEGAALAQRFQHRAAPMHFAHCDAFAPEAASWVKPGGHAVALHACGDLHTTLMRHWAEKGGAQLVLSPCCYHLIRTKEYVPMSSAGRNGQTRLGREDLQLPLQETVTAGAAVRRLRERELHWRLAFDELQRQVRAEDSYLPVPNVRKSLLQEGFSAFARWAGAQKKLVLPAAIDEALYLQLGWQRLRRVRRMELVTHVFRRPLELWLVLDRALFLQECGAEVELGEFCERELTPRNILLRAWRAEAGGKEGTSDQAG
ncbi:hypothetical protein Maes01_01420 [Microbulbifer aestuariivivens]|uniref:Methyltransferase domain-containing protein n=1 Tax=Microbulbifer aestuariivivens TaxID=1908308 RepID=A0ABP9WRU2_9GAMM